MTVSTDILAQYYGATITLKDWLSGSTTQSLIEPGDSASLQELLMRGRVASHVAVNTTDVHARHQMQARESLNGATFMVDVVQSALCQIVDVAEKNVLSSGYQRVNQHIAFLFSMPGEADAGTSMEFTGIYVP